MELLPLKENELRSLEFCDSFYNDKGEVKDNNFKLCEFVVLDYLRKRKLVGEPPATTNDIDKSKKLISKNYVYKILKKLERKEFV